MTRQTELGKAFEYACMKAFREFLREKGLDISIRDSDAYSTTEDCFLKLSKEKQGDYLSAAHAAVLMVTPLEPRILEPFEDETVCLAINSDAAGKGADSDVRDIVCFRRSKSSERWEIGFSCKHNHEAVKHPRVTKDCDFGSDWIGVPCHREFLKTAHEILSPLEGFTKRTAPYWRDVPDKESRFYVPLLEAHLREIERLCSENADVPKKLIAYFIGTKDFYKIISLEKDRMTKLQAFNINGDLAQPTRFSKPKMRIRRLKFPTVLLDASFVEEGQTRSKTTIELTFNYGWTVRMRLHNKDSKALKTSLAWDVTLSGVPSDLFSEFAGWER